MKSLIWFDWSKHLNILGSHSMFSITETINSRSDDIEVRAGFDYLTLILTLHQNLQKIQTGTDIKGLLSLSQFSQSHHSAHAPPHVGGTEKRHKCRERFRII